MAAFRWAAIREVACIALAFLCLLYIMRLLAGCSPAQVKADEAQAGYLAQELRCVDQYNDKPSTDECRAQVRARWHAAQGITETTADAGKDGAK